MYFSEQAARPTCKDAAVPFMCQYVFPLCDSTTGQLYLPTQQECLQISQQVCSIEWFLAKSLLSDYLPDCEKLPLQGGSGDGMEHCILQSIHMLFINIIFILQIYRATSMFLLSPISHVSMNSLCSTTPVTLAVIAGSSIPL